MTKNDFNKLKEKLRKWSNMPGPVLDELFDLLDEIRANRASIVQLERQATRRRFSQCHCDKMPPGE